MTHSSTFRFFVSLPILTGVTALAILIGFSGCTTMTSPEERIAKDPALFDSIPEKFRDTVRGGQVTEGMSQDAVFLAWGRPHEVKQSSREGRRLVTWIYYGTEAIPVETVGVGYGYYGPGCGGPVYDFGFDYAHRDYVAAKVEFEKDRVVYWERNERR